MLHTTPDVIQIAKISQYLAAVDSANGELFGQRVAPDSSLLLYMERKSLDWMNTNNPAKSTLPATTAYVYSLCRGFNIRAGEIVSGGSGGSIAPIVGSIGYVYTSLALTVGASETGTTYYHPYLVNGNSLTYIIYNNQDLTLNNGDFSVNYTTGVIALNTITLYEGDQITLSFNKKI